jgi:hypothetical protein
LVVEPPREPAAERRAEVRAAFAPERAPVAAALVARRAVLVALRAVLLADAPLRERDELELLRERVELELLRGRDFVDEVLRERELVLVERRFVERRLVPLAVRWSRGISLLTTSLTSCGMSFSR